MEKLRGKPNKCLLDSLITLLLFLLSGFQPASLIPNKDAKVQ